MFTGLVSDVGLVVAASGTERLRRVRIDSAYRMQSIALGASIACSGPCLTVVATGENSGGGAWFDVDVAAETLGRTTAGTWVPGTRLNLERSLKLGDELGGHIVTGHVDGMAEIINREAVTGGEGEWGATVRFVLRVPAPLARFIAEKGSVALDGTSLTVNDVGNDTVSVLLIPHTLAVTTWGDRSEGDRLNLEVDLMARYAARLVEMRAGGVEAGAGPS